MRGVARDATYTVGSMLGLLKSEVFLFSRMARQTTPGNDVRSSFLEIEDFGFITTAIDVLGARAVAGFATVRLSSTLGLQKVVPVAGLLKTIEDFFVAGFAGVSSDVLRRSRLLIGLGGRIFPCFLRSDESRDEER
jgi:hypothetical protein